MNELFQNILTNHKGTMFQINIQYSPHCVVQIKVCSPCKLQGHKSIGI